MRKKNSKKSPVSVGCSILGTTILIFLILVGIPLILPRIMGGQIYTVISGSMEPAIPAGSLVYAKGAEPEEIHVNDVIAFYGGRDANVIIIHRVVENHIIIEEFVTKGDANQTNDMNPVGYERLIGRVEWSVPEVGAIIQVMTGTEGKAAAGSLIFLAVALHRLASVLDRKQNLASSAKTLKIQ